MGKHELSRPTDPIKITAGFSAERYSFHATIRERGSEEPIAVLGRQSMEIATIEELGAELSPWISLTPEQEKILAADRSDELQRADREYREERALQREENGLEL